MQLQLIRNATLKLRYGGATLLIDPYLAPRHSLPSYAGMSPNPLVDLPMAIDAITRDAELVVVSHRHTDHFDGVAQDVLAKDMPLLCQPEDETALRTLGFTEVIPLADSLSWNAITFERCEASHGLGAITEVMGPVMGVILRHEDEPTLYLAGDTVLYPPVIETIRCAAPDLVVTHSCGAYWDGSLIVMEPCAWTRWTTPRSAGARCARWPTSRACRDAAC